MVCEFFKCYQKEAIILFHKHGVSPITVGLFLCCCTGFVKYLISNNSVAELRSLKKIIIDWDIFWATYSSCWEQSCTGFCTAGLIIWQFVHITFQTFHHHLMPMMWLPLKIISFSSSPPSACASLRHLPGSAKRMEKLSTGLVCRENFVSKPQYPLMQIAIRKDKRVFLFHLIQIYSFDS